MGMIESAAAPGLTSPAAAPATDQTEVASPIIEVVTLRIRSDVAVADFSLVDRDIHAEYIASRSGYISRESAPGDDHTWLVIVHWRSLADAQASMDSFGTAPAAAKFMSMIVPGSMIMTRYSRQGTAS